MGASRGPRPRGRLGPAAAIAAAAFTGTWAVLGAVSDGYRMWDVVVRPYSAVAQPISGLGLGTTAPVMNTAFVVCGALVTAGTWSAMGTWPGATSSRLLRWARPLVATAGVGMVLCGVFDLESILPHTLGFVLAAGVAPVGLVLVGYGAEAIGRPALRRWLRVAGPAGLGLLGWFFAAFDPLAAGSNEGYAGLVQRALITLLMVDVAAVGLSADREPGDGTATRTAPDQSAPRGRPERASLARRLTQQPGSPRRSA